MRKLFRELYGELAPFGRFWFILGAVALAAACAMSFFFGKSISLTHGVFLVVLSAVAAFGPHAAHKVYEMGKRPAGIALAVLCAPLLMIEFYSHAGYTAGLRGTNIGDAKVQQARYQSVHEGVSEDKTNLALWQRQLAELETAHAWAPTVSATGLRESLPAMDEAIRQETRRGGCGPKCLALTRDRAAVAEKIGIAERRDDLTAKIDATKRVLATARGKAETVEFKHSSAAHQNEFLGKLVALIGAGELRPSEFVTESAEQSVNLAMAIAGTGLPALCFFVAGCFARRTEDTETLGRPEAHKPAPTQTARDMLMDFYENMNRHVPQGRPKFAA